MMKSNLGTTLAIAAFGCLLSVQIVAQEQVRPYPDPGYRQMGIYAGGPDWIDYCMPKISLADEFPDKAQWWASMRAAHQAGRGNNHDVYILFFGLKDGISGEEAKRRIDAWLKPEPGIPTYPHLIPAVCLDEENVPHRHRRVLEELARHIRSTYGIAVFQWWSYPMAPSPDLTADGWLFDAYFLEYPRFRKHLMKFVSLGKPVICVLWASDPAWTGWAPGRFASTEELMNNVEDQFEACREFNVSTAIFAVAGVGALNPWLGSDTPDMVALRNWIRHKQAQMYAFKPGDLPLASADHSARSRSILVGGSEAEPSIYEENFSGFNWIDDANLTGFLEMKLTSLPEEAPGYLLAKTYPDRPVEASLTYRFESYFPLHSVEAELISAAPSAAQAVNHLALSLDGEDWVVTAEQSDNDEVESLVLRADRETLQGRRTFHLRVRMRNDAGAADVPANRLDRLVVTCVHQPEENAVAQLAEDMYGNLYYFDDFSTNRWRYLGTVEAQHPTHGGRRGGEFWVGMVGGYATSVHLVQRMSAPREMKELTVAVQGRVNTKDLGGHLDLGVAPRGEGIRWQTSTDEKEGGVYSGLTLQIPPEGLGDLRDFDVHIVLRSTSGVECGDKACASVGSLKIEGK